MRLLYMSQQLLYERQMCGRNLAASYVRQVLLKAAFACYLTAKVTHQYNNPDVLDWF
jgi:hypothetical protein